jgi:BolA protein
MASVPQSTAAHIEQLLQQRLKPAHLEVHDDSRAHVGHSGADGKGHFHLKIVSSCFEGMKPVARHRLVNDTLAPLFETEVHALGLETLTPGEFNK